jgi:hypothetical protein
MLNEALIVVAEDDQAATETREVIAGWARAELLREIYWVTATSEQASASASKLSATIVDATGERDVDLLSDLARRPLSRIKLLALALEDQVGDIQAVVAVASTIYEEFVDSVSIPLDRIALIVPVEASTSVGDLSVARPGWSVVVASAEDRPSSNFVAKPVTRDDNLAGHAALLLSIIGARWHGMARGPLDGPDESGSGGTADLRVGRAYGRVVFGDAVLEDVIGATLGMREHWPRPIVGGTPMPEGADRARVLSRVADDLVAADEAALRYHAYEPPPVAPPRMVTPLEALREFGRFMIGRFLKIPEELWARVKGEVTTRIETFVQNLTYGQNSQVVVRLGPARTAVVPAKDLGADAARLLEFVGQAALEISEARPDLWRTVRQSAIGLIDGSPMPQDVREPTVGDGPRVVVPEPAFISPNPDDQFVLGDDVNRQLELPDGELPTAIGFVDAYIAPRVRSRLELLVRERQARARAHDDDADPVVDRVLEHAQLLLSKLTTWEMRRDPNLLWDVAQRTGLELDTARQDVEESLGVLESGVPAPDLEALRRAIRKMTIRSYIAATLMVLGIGTGVVLGILGPIVWSAAAGIGVVSLIIGGLGGFLAFWRFKREEFQLLHRPMQQLAEYQIAAERLIQATREVVRLTSHYEQLQLWSEVVARISRHPWKPEVRDSGVDLSTVVTPLALQISRGSTTPALRDGLVGIASRDVFNVGWMLECYEQVATQADVDYCRHFALEVAPPPEMDRPALRVETMEGMLGLLREQTLGARIFEERRKEVVRRLSRLRPTDVFDTCEPVGAIQGYDDSAPTRNANEFLREVTGDVAGSRHFRGSTFTSFAVTNDLHRVAATTVWRPAGVVGSDSTGIVEQTLDPGVNVADDEALNAIVLRFEASGVVRLTDLALYGADAARDEPERILYPDPAAGSD